MLKIHHITIQSCVTPVLAETSAIYKQTCSIDITMYTTLRLHQLPICAFQSNNLTTILYKNKPIKITPELQYVRANIH